MYHPRPSVGELVKALEKVVVKERAQAASSTQLLHNSKRQQQVEAEQRWQRWFTGFNQGYWSTTGHYDILPSTCSRLIYSIIADDALNWNSPPSYASDDEEHSRPSRPLCSCPI